MSGRRTGGGRTDDWRRALPVIFLGLSLAVAGFGSFEAWRAERSHRDTVSALLRDYGGYAARGFETEVVRRMNDGLGAVFATTRNTRAFVDGTATAQCLQTLLEPTCACGAQALSGAWALHSRLSDDPTAADWAGVLPAPGIRARVLEAVRAHARTEYRANRVFAVLHLPGGPTVAYTRIDRGVTFTRSYEATADTLLWAIEVAPAGLDSVYLAALDNPELLPPALVRDREVTDFVQIEVVTPDGNASFRSRPDIEHLLPSEAPLPEGVGGAIVRASVLPDMADQLAIGGLPGDRTPVLLLIVILAAAVGAAAVVQLRREDRLARLRQDFVASVSHELRTPLSQVRLFTETLTLGRVQDDGQRAWALENIDRETRRLSQLVENILHFSRSERGVHAVEREPVDLAEEIRDAVEAFRPLVPAHKARLVVDSEGPLVAEVHRGSIRQVLLNFLDNAVRYGPAGQTIRIAGERTGGRIVLAVEDEGPGVPVDERKAIFEPFRRGESQVGTARSGSGIGLSVVYEVASAHGGDARVEDASGGGARFVLELDAVDTVWSDRLDDPPPTRMSEVA